MTKAPSIHHKLRYGAWWGPLTDSKGTPVAERPDWVIEREVLRFHRKHQPPGYLGYSEHFKNLSNHFFGSEDGVWMFQWNPNACEILDKHIKYNRLSVAGHASSSKSETLVLIAYLTWFISPYDTKVILSSKDKNSARKKCWGSVQEAHQQMCNKLGGEHNVPGKLLASQCIIRYEWNGVQTDKAGLELIAGEQSAASESCTSLQGTKRENVLICLDEAATVHHSIYNTIVSNVMPGNENVSLIGALNPESHYDVGGVISKPKDGWESVNVDDRGWETEIGGYCLHFDGLKSPNVVAGKKVWRGLLDQRGLDEEESSAGGKNTKKFWQMVRGFWSPTGTLESIYSEADIITYKADHPVTNWIDRPTKLASLDPAFAHGGDFAVAVIGQVGTVQILGTNNTQKVFERLKTVILADDVTKKGTSRSEQVARDFKALLIEEGIETKNVAVDATGGGDPFSALLARDIGTGFLMVGFKERPSDLPVSRNDKRKSSDRFTNKVSELWGVGRELIRTGQIKGLDPDTIIEMCARSYTETGGKMTVESKEKMKLRTNGKSPDRSDSLFICVEVARQRHNLSSNEKAATKPKTQSVPLEMFGIPNPGARKKIMSPWLEQYETADSGGGGWGY